MARSSNRGRYHSDDQSYSQWCSERNDNIISDRRAKNAKERKGQFVILRGTAESGFIGYTEPMSYEDAYWEKRNHDKARKHDDPFPSFVEIVEWKGEDEIKNQAEEKFGWMKGRSFLKKEI